MKLTQELVVTIVFLGGSWVTLSVVAVAFPPATSSIRAAISANTKTKHVKTVASHSVSAETLPAEDVLPTEDTTTFLQDEKPNVVQVVTSDAKKDELFILGEDETVSDKVIEDNPNAKMVVIGADESTAKTKVDKFNLAAKNVAVRVALAKQAATRQAEADFRKLQEWRENGSHFALEVKARRFEYSVHDVLKDKLEDVANMPELSPANARIKMDPSIPNNTNSTPNQFTMLKDKLISWRDDTLRFASDFSAKQQLHHLVCYLEGKQDNTVVAPVPQASAPTPAVKSAAAPKDNKADIKTPDLRPANAKLTLDIPKIDGKLSLDTSTHRYLLQDKAVLNASLTAMNDHAAQLPLSTAVVYQPAAEPVKAIVAAQPVKTIEAPHVTVKTAEVNSAKAADYAHTIPVLPLVVTAIADAHTSYSPVSLGAIKTAEAKTEKPLDINKVHAATTKVLQQPVKVAVTKTKAAAKALAQLPVVKTPSQAHLKQLAAAEAKHNKVTARENAIASLERQLSNEPAVIVVPAKPAQQKVAALGKPQHQQQIARTQYQQQAARAQQPVTDNDDNDSQEMRAQQMARRAPAERDPFEEYFEQQEQKSREIEADRSTTNIAAMDQVPTDEEARDISGDMRRPEEYSRLMEE